MGQGHHGGVLYGSIVTDSQLDRLYDEDDGIIEAFEKHRRACLPPWPEPGSPTYEDVRRAHAADAPNRPDTAYETQPAWVGFWIADIDDSFSDPRWPGRGSALAGGALARVAMPFSREGVRKRYRRQYESAVSRWREFQRFAATRGLRLRGRLLLVTDWD